MASAVPTPAASAAVAAVDAVAVAAADSGGDSANPPTPFAMLCDPKSHEFGAVEDAGVSMELLHVGGGSGGAADNALELAPFAKATAAVPETWRTAVPWNEKGVPIVFTLHNKRPHTVQVCVNVGAEIAGVYLLKPHETWRVDCWASGTKRGKAFMVIPLQGSTAAALGVTTAQHRERFTFTAQIGATDKDKPWREEDIAAAAAAMGHGGGGGDGEDAEVSACGGDDDGRDAELFAFGGGADMYHEAPVWRGLSAGAGAGAAGGRVPMGMGVLYQTKSISGLGAIVAGSRTDTKLHHAATVSLPHTLWEATIEVSCNKMVEGLSLS